VFAESGFAAPLDEIAARAGVGAGTVYRHFSSKEALFEAVVTARVTDLAADARRRAAEDDPGTTFSGSSAGRRGRGQAGHLRRDRRARPAA
jgi:AcrR family transcriptional regulator